MKFKESYPRYDRETPEFLRKTINNFARSELHEGDTYDEETFVLKQEKVHLPENLLALSEKDLQNPHIKFYVKQNPEYTKVCVQELETPHMHTEKSIQVSLCFSTI